MNKVVEMGRLTADPELRQTQSGTAVCRFTIAVNRRFKNQQGEYDADFISCVAWKQTAEFVSRYFGKGSMICVEGSLRTGSYTDRNHSDVTHYTTEVYVENVEFTGEKKQQGTVTNYAAAGTPQQERPHFDTINDAGKNNSAQSMVNQAQNAGVQTQQASFNDFEALIADSDVPF